MARWLVPSWKWWAFFVAYMTGCIIGNINETQWWHYVLGVGIVIVGYSIYTPVVSRVHTTGTRSDVED